MPSSSSLLAFSAAAFALIVVPGPSVLFVVSRRRSAGGPRCLTVVGNAFGAYVQVLCVAWGSAPWSSARGHDQRAHRWLSGRTHRIERRAVRRRVMIGLGLRLALTGRKD